MNRTLSFITGLTLSSVLFSACSSSSESEETLTTNSGKADVVVHELSDADMLNPYNYSDAGAGYIIQNLFQSLISIDFRSLELVPVLAVSRPEITKTDNGGLLITYEIRPEAVWDNGEPITGHDVEFSLKVIKNPKVNNQRIRPYYEFIEDILIDPDNPKKFTLVASEVYILAEAASGDYSIIPAHTYDPKGLMKDFTIPQLNEQGDALSNDPKIIEFANDFNSEKYMREKDFIEGSGAYQLGEWLTGQRIVLNKKQNWWGDNVTNNSNIYLEANAPSITYQTINDQTTALVALKAGNIDVNRAIKAKDFIDLKKSDKFNENFHAHTPDQLEYNYIGINMRNPILKDRKVRVALAHLVDVPKIIELVQYGLATQIVGPIHYTNKKDYNDQIKPYEFSPEKAKALLAEAGWNDTDGDGVLDKMIDGRKTPFEITYIYNTGNDERKAVGLMLQEEARKVGIKINVQNQEWSVFLDNTKSHRFDIFHGGWISTPVPNDHKQIYHTTSTEGGSNYMFFGNARSDALIDSIRVELDEERRGELNKEFQQILHEEVPMIYMFARKNKLAIHKRFDNADPSVMRPGYWEAGFSVGQTVTK